MFSSFGVCRRRWGAGAFWGLVCNFVREGGGRVVGGGGALLGGVRRAVGRPGASP